MGLTTTTQSEEAELTSLKENQIKLVDALQVLYDLLEAYAPAWYSEEHHNLANAALSLPRRYAALSVQAGSCSVQARIKGGIISSPA